MEWTLEIAGMYIAGSGFFRAATFVAEDVVDNGIPKELHVRERDHSELIGLQDFSNDGSIVDIFQGQEVDIWYQRLNPIFRQDYVSRRKFFPCALCRTLH